MSREIIKIPVERRNGRFVIDNANGEDAILRNKLIAMGKQQGVVPSEGWDKWAAVSIRNLLDLFERRAPDVYEFESGDDLTPPVSILFGRRSLLERISDLDALNIAWQQASEESTSEACPDRPR